MGPKIFASNWSKWTLSFIGSFFHFNIIIVKNLSKNISAIRNLRKQPSNVVKLAWYIIIIGTAVAFLVHVGFLIAQYVQFNSSANLKASPFQRYIHLLIPLFSTFICQKCTSQQLQCALSIHSNRQRSGVVLS